VSELHGWKEPIPVTIISGFLGAGKTSLLNHILSADHGLRVAVLVNDFGEINVDAELVTGVSGESTISLSNGCICCSIRDDLVEAAVQLIEDPNPPAYIVVETSGVSDPAAVSLTFLATELQSRTRVDSVLTVVDAEQIYQVNEEHRRLAVDQIAMADIVVVNKLDLVSDAEREEVAAFIRDIVPGARILEATYGAVPLELVLGVGAYDLQRFAGKPGLEVHVHEAGGAHEHDHAHGHHHAHHANHTIVFDTWSYTTRTPLSYPAVREALRSLPATIYRAKGFLYLNDLPNRKGIVHVVGRRARLMVGERWGDAVPATRLVFIGAAGGIDKGELQARFDACQAGTDAHPQMEPDVVAAFELIRELLLAPPSRGPHAPDA
jgi:G3E family GTPase